MTYLLLAADPARYMHAGEGMSDVTTATEGESGLIVYSFFLFYDLPTS
jgi:hypothetical protein